MSSTEYVALNEITKPIDSIVQLSHLTWFYYTVSDAVYSPNIQGQQAFAIIAGFYGRLLLCDESSSEHDSLPYTAALEFFEKFHQATRATDWPEAIVKTVIGDTVALGLQYIFAGKHKDDLQIPTVILEELRAIISKNPSISFRLDLYCRRIGSESITLAQRIYALYEDTLGDSAVLPILNTVATLTSKIEELYLSRMKLLNSFGL